MVFERLVDDAALAAPGTPADEALRAYRAFAERPPAGRLRCPVSRLAELRRHLVPEDLLDLAVVADARTDDALPGVLDGVRGEPRVRPVSVHAALPPDADQARATAVAIARLPRDAPVFIGVRHRPGRRASLDRIAAARARGVPLGVEFRAEEAAEFVPACLERDLPFTCTAADASPALLLRVLLLTANARTSPGPSAQDGRADRASPHNDRTAAAPDASFRARSDGCEGLMERVRGLDRDAVGAVRRVFVGFAVPDVAAFLRGLDDLGPVRTRDIGEHLSP
ncbi:hypothetical protein BJF79_11515 [Actinomadura sp. CNU-125]|uniref:hypothetical protein n=1 Tax=Actinomadura sp. CNU-125 TaxID=1904961 RepID=UPI000959A46D|nr:hypothetical protein [Actinomadura sp. CNU-125]OLT27502.1 hypothetical protein BJF79_11515 [Actinomadura sp. CNU-125]